MKMGWLGSLATMGLLGWLVLGHAGCGSDATTPRSTGGVGGGGGAGGMGGRGGGTVADAGTDAGTDVRPGTGGTDAAVDKGGVDAGTGGSVDSAIDRVEGGTDVPFSPGAVKVTPTSGLTTSERGAQAVFGMVLDSAPTANVTVSVASNNIAEGIVSPASVTFTPLNWNAPQLVTITGVDDVAKDGDMTYLVLTAAATSADSRFAGVDPPDVQVVNTDDETAGVMVSATDLLTSEAGDEATISVVLTSKPRADVTIPVASSDPEEGTVSVSKLVFTPSNWNAPQKLTVTGVDDPDADGPQMYSIVLGAATSSDPDYAGSDPADITLSNIDNDSPGITVVLPSLPFTTEHGGQVTFTVVLNSRPSAAVTIPLTSSDTGEGTVSPAALVFTPSNWKAPQTVTVTGVDDAVADGSQLYTVVTGAATSSDTGYAGLDATDATLSNTDDDSAGVTLVAAADLKTTEAGGQATFTVVLNSQPRADVTMQVTSSNPAEGTVSPALLTFTSANWNAPQTVTLTGIDDAVADGNQAYHVSTGPTVSTDVAYAGLTLLDVPLTNTDNDSAGITVIAAEGLETTEAGGQATFTVVLNSEPKGDVTLALTSSNTGEGTVSPATLTFTASNWKAPQTVTVTGVDDDAADGKQPYEIATGAAASSDAAYDHLDATDVRVFNADNDSPGVRVQTTTLATTEAGGQVTFTVALGSRPSSDVIIPLTSNDTAEGTVSPASLTFTAANWNAPRTVTVTGVDDAVADGNQPYVVTLAAAVSADPGYAGLDPEDVTLINRDNDSAGIRVVAASLLSTTEAGGQATFTVVLDSQPTASVTIAVSSSAPNEGHVSPSSLTFTRDNWSAPQTVTVSGVDDAVADGNQPYHIITAPAVSDDPGYQARDADDVELTNTDDDSAGITVTPTRGLVTTEDGGQSTFTVALNSQPVADVTVTVASLDTTEGRVSRASLVFTELNWNAPQTVTVTGVNDDVADGNQPYRVGVNAATSADPAYAGLDAIDVEVSNTDNDSAGITITPTQGLVTTEAGGDATFAIVLNSEPTSPVTITLASDDQAEGVVSPSFVTFTPGNWNAPQIVTVTGVNDDVADGNQPYSILTGAAMSSDSGYAGLDSPNVQVSNTDNDSAGITVTPTSGLVTTEAGGQTTFTVVLSSKPRADVTVALGSSDPAEGTVSPTSLTFTGSNWNAPRTVTVTGVNDDIADGNQPYRVVTLAAVSSDTGYAGLDAADVSVSNVDNDTASIIVAAASHLTTTEAGGQATFTVVLGSQPTANVVIPLASSDPTEGTLSPPWLTFTPTNWNAPQTVTVAGVNDDVADGNQPYAAVTGAAMSADPNYSAYDTVDVAVSNTDNDSPGITVVAAAGLTTTEAGGHATFTVVLNSEPTANVSIPIGSSALGEGTVSPSSLSFTANNWNAPQIVTVTGVNDDVADGDQPYTVITGAAISVDGNYNGTDPANVSVTNTDNDSAGITVAAATGLSTTEAGGQATFTVVLNSQPTATVTVSVASSDTGEGVASPASLVFSANNWNAPQTVTVTGVNDDVADGNQPYSIVTAQATSGDGNYAAIDPADVPLTNTDNDSAGITVTAAADLTTTEAGGQATFTVVLNSQPTAGVTIALTTSDGAEGTVSPASLTFTAANWNAPRTVTVTGVNDDVADGNQPYSIVTAQATSGDGAYAALNPADVPLTNTDNDSAGITVTAAAGLATTEAGGTATFTVRLNSQPKAPVIIALTSSDTGEGTVAGSPLTFTAANWNAPQLVTVTGVDDAVADGNQPYSIVTAQATSSDNAYAALNPTDVSLTNTDNDSAGITVTAVAGLTTTEAGGTATFTVRLNSQPRADVTVAFSSNDTAEGTVSPSSVTFNAGDWNTPRTVTVTGVDDAVADGNQPYSVITAQATSSDSAYAAIDPVDVALTNTDNDSAGFTVTPVSGLQTTEAGGTATFTVVLTSQPTAGVSIGLTSSNTAEGTVSPSSLSFSTGNWNTPRTVTVTGVNDSAADGNQVFSIITAAASSSDTGYGALDPVDVSVTNNDDDVAGITLTGTSGLTTTEQGGTATFTVVLDTLPSADVTIPLTSSNTNEGTVSPASLTFSAANWNTPQTVTLTGVNDGVVDGDQTYTIQVGPASSGDSNYSGLDPADPSLTNREINVAGSALATGVYHACALKLNGAAYCWGYNGNGQLGDGTTTARNSPTAVLGGLTFAALSTKYLHTCGLTAAGTAYCWGDNGNGGIGDGTTTARLQPTAVSGGLTFTQLAVGYQYACGLIASGAAYCWGNNNFGQLGDGSTTSRSTPVAVGGGLTFTSMVAEDYSTCGLTSSGTPYCWGYNSSGQLGNGSTTNRNTPTAVSGGLTFTQLLGGWLTTCGLTSGGAAYCWGTNSNGQVGDGTTTMRLIPTAVAGGLTFTALSKNAVYAACGLVGTAAYCWGYNSNGQLGDGTQVSPRKSPVAVTGGINFSSINPGHQHSCGLATSGTIYCWGYNGDGALGDGTNTNRLAPGAVTLP